MLNIQVRDVDQYHIPALFIGRFDRYVGLACLDRAVNRLLRVIPSGKCIPLPGRSRREFNTVFHRVGLRGQHLVIVGSKLHKGHLLSVIIIRRYRDRLQRRSTDYRKCILFVFADDPAALIYPVEELSGIIRVADRNSRTRCDLFRHTLLDPAASRDRKASAVHSQSDLVACRSIDRLQRIVLIRDKAVRCGRGEHASVLKVPAPEIVSHF